MAETKTFFVSYEGELTNEDRAALTRPGWKLYENGIGVTAAFRGHEMPPVEWSQIVRLSANDAEEAKRLVIDALGRQPEGLRANAALEDST